MSALLGNAASVGTNDNMLFDESTGLFHDPRYQRDRDRQSTESRAYFVSNFRDLPSCGARPMSMALSHPNLRFKNGYGNLDACNVEADNRIRLRDTKHTNTKYRQQLSTRVAVAGPDLSRGLTSADVESELLHSADERQHQAFKGLPGVRSDELSMAPLIPFAKEAQRVQHIVPTWQITDTRALVRDADYARRSCARP